MPSSFVCVVLAASIFAVCSAVSTPEALKIVLNEQHEHQGIETHYIKESENMDSIMEGNMGEARQTVMDAAEKKQIFALALEMKACRKGQVDETVISHCMQSVKDKFLGPVPQMNSTRDPKVIKSSGAAELEAALASKVSDDPKVMERIQQIYATKMETFNLLRSELNLVQGLGQLLSGEQIEGASSANTEINALQQNSYAQARGAVVHMVRKGLRPPPDYPTKENPNPYGMVIKGTAIMPEKRIVPNATTTAPPSEWDIYRSKLQHAAYVDDEGLGPDNWNPTEGRTMLHETIGPDED